MMKYSIYEEYISMERSLSFEEMGKLHTQLLEEIGNDKDALELYEELLVTANKYSVFRAGWCLFDREEKCKQDESRSACHDAMIVKFNKLARYKFAAKNPHACVWDESCFSFT